MLRMSANGLPRRIVLVPRDGPDGRLAAGSPHIRRFGLARVGVSPRSALGMDRHERLERVADAERHQAR
jgi:hypothetical protein